MLRRFSLTTAMALVLACHDAPKEPPLQRSAPPTPLAVPTSSAMRVSTFEPAVPRTTLRVPGFATAAISLPSGPVRKWPLVIAAHGYDDVAEGFCENARDIFGGRAFILCPRGVPAPGSAYGGTGFHGTRHLEREIEAGVTALQTQYPDLVDIETRVFFGFSQGATLGAPLVRAHPSLYPMVILAEGGETGWSKVSATAFLNGGGKRVLFACGLRSRLPSAKLSAALFGDDRGRAFLARLPGKEEFIHWYNGPVAAGIREQLPWLLADDARWN